MPQKAIPSTSRAATVRAYLGLTQAELARYLGVTRGQVAHIEAGRKLLGPQARRRLSQLADLLPAPLGLAADDAAAPVPALPTARPLQLRLLKCRRQAAELRQELEQRAARARQAQRWLQLLPRLRAALGTGAEAASRLRWMESREAEATAALDADEAATQLLLTIRLKHLEAEAAELAQVLVDIE